MADVKNLLASADEIVAAAEAERRNLTDDERKAVKGLLADAESAKMRARIDSLGSVLGTDTPAPAAGRLYQAIKAAGWDARSRPVVEVASKDATFSGDLDDLSPVRADGPPMGHDQRYLYPVLRREDVTSGTTSVTILRQSARTLATPGDMVRDLDATTTKPETSSTKEVAVVSMHQIASVSKGIPNVLLEAGLRDVIEADLRLALSDAIDDHVVTTITGASPPVTTPGADLLASTREAIETVQSAGYNPDVLAVSPADAADLDLLQSSGSEALYQFATAARSVNVAPVWGLRLRVVKGLTDPIVLDSRAIGVLYLSPARLGTFEENDGQTNSSTVRLELHGAFALQRTDAATVISAGS